MTTGTLLEKPPQRIPPEERVGSFLATSQTPSELKLDHLQDSQVAEGVGSLQALASENEASLQAQVASDLDVVPQRVQPPIVPPIRLEPEDIAPEARLYLNGDMEKLARILITLIEVESAKSWMPVEKVDIGLKRSYEEDWV